MCQAAGVVRVEQTGSTGIDLRRRAIHDAAIAEFSERGYAGTSMANIAARVGVSRPALYQYFSNKGDIFVSAFVALYDDRADVALAALDINGPLAERLDGFLQRFDGDLWERMAASPHSEELMQAKPARTTEELAAVIARVRVGLDEFLARIAPGHSRAAATRRNGWAELLALAPKGFKADSPGVDHYRRRLNALAHSVAADIASERTLRAGVRT